MANTFKFGNGQWAVGKETALAYNDENSNFKPLPFSFDRASTATVVNSNGLIETVGTDEPRIDFLNNTKGHLLLEPSRTNLVTQSENFASGWVLDDATIVSNSATSPDGNSNATLFKGNTNSSRHNIVRGGLSASNTAVFSLFVKAKELRYIQIAGANTVNQYVNFDAENGIVGTVGSSFSNAKIEAIGSDGWYRCSVVSNNQYNGFYINLVSGLNAGWIESWTMPNSTDGLYIYGAQLEAGSYATSYIPTSGSAVTRSAETAVDSGNTNVINSIEGTLYTEIEGFISTDTVEQNRYITLTNGTSNERVALLLGGNTNQLRAIAYSNTQGINLSFTTSLTDVKQFNKLAVKYKSGDYAFFLNGTKIGSSSETSIFTANTLNDISFDVGGGTQQFRGKVKDLKVYNTALSDSELQALTS